LIGGQLVALAVLIVLQHLLSKAAMASWGWRVPFVIGAALALVAYQVRRRMQESASFVSAAAEAESDVAAARGSLRALAEYPRETLTIFGLTAGGSMIFYVYTTYMQKFLTNTAGFSKDQATELSAATLVAFMLAQPLCGWLSDKVGRKLMLMIAFAGGAVVTWPILTRVAVCGSLADAFLLIVAAVLFESAYTSISAVVKAELFPTNVRSLGVALPYALANAMFGGTAEYVALWFKQAGAENRFYVYASALSAVSFLVAVTMKDTRRHSRIRED
jgi:MHS family alpha-ketoglutarate permease-like MFS transporter